MDKLILLLIDKVLLAGIAAAVWHVYKRRERAIEREQARADRYERANEDLARETAVQRVDARISFLEQSLEEFYWPLLLCMRKDDAIWQRVPALYDDGTQLPSQTGELIEQNFLLPNHDRAVAIIEGRYHLVAGTDRLIEPMISYIRHVAVFKALRAAKSDNNPIDVDEPFPQALIPELEAGLDRCRKELAKLKETRAKRAVRGPSTAKAQHEAWEPVPR